MPSSSHSRTGAFAEVAVPAPIRHLLTYAVPDTINGKIQPGSAVLVPLGKRRVTGYVVGLADSTKLDPSSIRKIHAVVDDAPFFTGELLNFILAVSDYYAHPLGETFRTAVPAGLEAGEVEGSRARSRLKPRCDFVARPVIPLKGDPFELMKRATRRAEVFERIRVAGSISLSELRKTHKNVRSFIKPLEKDGWITIEKVDSIQDPFFEKSIEADEPPVLNSYQSSCVDAVCRALDTRNYSPFLLHGVTGSGKTEVYLRVIERAREKGLGALVLVPEIGLTPQLVARFRARFGDELAVLHSGLKKRQRVEQWRAVRSGRVNLVIGARSAVFAPLKKPGVIIVDEEHDASFKQSTLVRYNARDMALLRAKNCSAVAVLGSATPSMESWNNVEAGKLSLLEIPERATPHPLPEVGIIDLRRHRSGPEGQNIITGPLYHAIGRTLEAGEQVILFLNRRGFSPLAVCTGCGETMQCRSCSVSLTYHRRANVLRCHYCGGDRVFPEKCPVCHEGDLDIIGSGTEQAQVVLEKLFPDHTIARLDSDVASGTSSERILEKLRRREIDILVGTQMVTKGHDFPGVTLVGVLLADIGFGLPDFRASERAFQILTQVAGRAGRGDKKGSVLIQTYHPHHPAVECAVEHDPVKFRDLELEARKELEYPPFSRLLLLGLKGKNQNSVKTQAHKLAAAVRRVCPPDRAGVIGPAPAPIGYLRGLYRWRIMVRAGGYGILRHCLKPVLEFTPRGGVRIAVDIDPVDLM